MLDNFGMGEFLMLAIFALLFFGPERLPQMGARLGRWLSQLTQASKVFMTQWTEEAAAIQDAVREVQGIRDEIRAAQAEISSSLDVARQEVVQTIDEARSTVREAAITPQAILKAGEEANRAAAASRPPDTSAPPRLATPEEVERATPVAAPAGSESEALSKTQRILDDLMAKRGRSPAAESKPGDNGLGTTPAEASSDAQESEYERNLRAIREIQERDARRAAERAKTSETAAGREEAPSAQPQAVSPAVDQADQAVQAEQEVKPVRESAYDKTQRLLDGLLGKSRPEAAAEAPAVEPPAVQDVQDLEIEPAGPPPADGGRAEPVQEAAPDRAAASGPKALPGEPAGSAAEAAAPARTTAAPRNADLPKGVQRVTGLQKGVGFDEFTRLSIEVTQLRRELRSLQEELQALRIQSQPAAVPMPAADEDSQAATIEEAA